jgi:RNA polymerase sigma factor (sigma-70 family)
MSTIQTGWVRHLRRLAVPSIKTLSDQQLVEQFVDRQEQASFAALVQRHGPMVLAVCRRVLHHTQDAEDAFQATFLVLARKAGSIRKQGSVASFLYGVAHRVASKLRAQRSRRVLCERQAPPRTKTPTTEELTWRELRSVLDEELGSLPEDNRAPLVLCYLEGRTQDEAARQLGWSLGTFRRRLEQARARLGRRLTRRGLALSAVLSAPLLASTAAEAMVCPVLAAATLRAALLVRAGGATGDLVSARVASLADSGSAPMLTLKSKAAFVLLVALGLTVGGMLALQAPSARQSEPPAAPKAQAAVGRAESPPLEKGLVELKGRLLDPGGKPLAGARVFLLSEVVKPKDGATARATTDGGGKFRIAARREEVERGGKLLATASGHGPAWVALDADKIEAVTLKLVKDDVPITGRVLDLEGKPIAGVRVQAVSLHQGDIDAWMEGIRQHRYPHLPSIDVDFLGESAMSVTDADGRFRLSGFGRDRVVHVLLHGDNIEDGDFEVATRREIIAGLHRGNNGVYPAAFDHLTGPSKPIVGTVRDKRSGEPLVGIKVACPMIPSWIWATTDAKGRYRLNGVGKHKQYWVAAGGIPYFNCTKLDIADTPGTEPLTVDFALERGVVVRGRLVDAATGKPVRGRVNYVLLPENPNAKDFTDVGKAQLLVSDPGRTGPDGSFAVVAVPGPGLLCARADDDGRYLPAVIPAPRPSISLILEEYHAVVAIDPKEGDAKSTARDLTLEPAGILPGTVTDPEGKPLAGAHVAGMSGTVRLLFGRTQTLESASFTAGGISPDHPRKIVFYHVERKLAKVQSIRGDEKGPLAVRLQPLSTVTGRVVDADGRPRAGVKVKASLFIPQDDRDDLPLELLLEYPSWGKLLNRETTTDTEGRFRLEGLVPGLRYEHKMDGDKPRTQMLAPPGPGSTKDLGDLKSQ